MSRRILVLVIGLMLTGMVGCSSHHHGSYGYGKGDYYWSKAGKDMSGLIEKTCQGSREGQAGERGPGRDHHRVEIRA